MQFEFELGQPLTYRTPLHYPGGKKKTWKHFKNVFPTNITTLVSPFCGGCAIELICASNGVKVIASDRVEPLINFWNQYQQQPDQIINQAIKWFPLPYDEAKVFFENELAPFCKDIEGKKLTNFERAAIYFLINRQNFRGLTLIQGPQRKIKHGDANVELFLKYKGFYNPNITFICSDYKDILNQYEGNFMYFDPPYIGTEYVYGTKSDKNLGFNHEELAEQVTTLNNRWIMSYRKHDLIMDLYKDYRIIEYNYNHSHGSQGAKEVTELFILNW